MIIREEQYGRPAVCSFQLSAELSFELIVEIFISRCCFRGSFKAAFPRGLRLYAKYAANFSSITSFLAISLTRDDPSLSFVMAQDSREEREKTIRSRRVKQLTPCFQSLNNQEWEKILLSDHKWRSLPPLKPSFRHVSEGAWHQPSVHNRCAYVSWIKASSGGTNWHVQSFTGFQ